MCCQSLTCILFAYTYSHASTDTSTPHPLMLQPLPDISDWTYGGTTSLGNSDVHIWQLFERKWGKTSTYTFYTTPEGLPVRWERVKGGGWKHEHLRGSVSK